VTSHTVWPANLVTCALFNTLHAQTYAGIGNRGGLSRERFFFYAFGASTIWYFFPGYLFTALSTFSWVCWIVPNNIPVNEMFGYGHGMGMSLITFDWAQIAYIGSPLATPWWAEANVAAGFVFFFCKRTACLINPGILLICALSRVPHAASALQQCLEQQVYAVSILETYDFSKILKSPQYLISRLFRQYWQEVRCHQDH